MIEDPVAEWRELSALYEQADQLSGAALRDWIAGLPDDVRQLVPRLERMLAARDRAAAEQFLEALPPLSDVVDDEPLGWEAGRRVGPYRLVRHAGSGGMAEVWLAERDDGAFARTVAIKLLRNHPTRSERDTFVERFRRERDILASLDHPNIARLHDAGVSGEGQPWLALEFVEGEAITAWCDRERLTIEDRVRLFRQVLLAIEHAHARLVIHRDVKPSNVLVTAAGAVSLLDFGIAKLLEAEGDSHVATLLTQRSGRPMTPQYASPEQLLGEPLTTACDVYSLGVMLYEVLTGQLPYLLKGRTPAQFEAAVTQIDPSAPSSRTFNTDALAARQTSANALRRALRLDLDAIVLRALEKSPARRYESVGAMRSELDRWLKHEPVLATVPRSTYRLAKFLRRHRVGVAISAALSAVIAGFMILTVLQSIRAERESERALAARVFLLDAFGLSDPDKTRIGDTSAFQMLDSSLDRADRLLASQPKLHADVLQSVADIDQRVDRYTNAQDAFLKASTLYAALGDRKEWAKVQIDLANNSWRMGDLELANRIMTGSLSTLEKFPDDHELQARGQLVRGWIARKMGRLDVAKEYMTASLTTAESIYGERDTRTADALRGLAEVELAMKDYDAARRHIQLARQDELWAGNATPTDLAGIELEQAFIESSAGWFAAALPLMQSAAKNCDATLGSQAENCFLIRTQEAILLIKIGRVQDALLLLPAFFAEGKNDASPDRQANARVIALRVLEAAGMWSSAREMKNELQTSLDNPSLTLPDSVRLSIFLALAELDVRQRQGTAANILLDKMASQVDMERVDGAFRSRTLMLRGLATRDSGIWTRRFAC